MINKKAIPKAASEFNAYNKSEYIFLLFSVTHAFSYSRAFILIQVTNRLRVSCRAGPHWLSARVVYRHDLLQVADWFQCWQYGAHLPFETTTAKDHGCDHRRGPSTKLGMSSQLLWSVHQVWQRQYAVCRAQSTRSDDARDPILRRWDKKHEEFVPELCTDRQGPQFHTLWKANVTYIQHGQAHTP